METVPVRLGDRSYDIMIEAGSLPRTGSFVRRLAGEKTAQAAVVTTDTVAGLYLEPVVNSLVREGFIVTRIIIPDGEKYKTIATWESILTRLIESRFERKSILVPLGGGVVGDVGGFAAAAFLRGIPFVQVPTTIVAQVDSSIGGKVAVNHPLGKNLIGSFYQPCGVWIDPLVLRTLNRREVVSGMGEVIKHAMIRDAGFFTFLEDHLDSLMDFSASHELLERFIAWNCRIKAEVVAADERESGLRATLNYGHTVGHALETVTRYSRFSHGEAVMFGMIAAAEIARDRGLISGSDTARQNALLLRAGMSCDVRGISLGEILGAMKLDKKVIGGKIRFVLPGRIGSVDVYSDVGENEMLHGINYMLEFCGKRK
ncbi:MAG: 3-dehydroquinate synthase [Candidatus Latescibacter sp.]|nr:3-dehydroquinate synthase [Candidatus Latescibacter sp.]